MSGCFRIARAATYTTLSGLAYLLVACAPAQGAKAPGDKAGAEAPGSSEAKPAFDMDAMLAREVEELPPAAAVSGKGWTAQVQGASPRVSGPDQHGNDEVSIPIGTAAPVTCVVFATPIDIATTMAATIQAFEKNVQIALIRPIDVFVEQEVPVLELEVKYTVDKPEGKAGGQVKLAAGPGPRSFLCLHDEPGYVKSFERVVRGFASTLEDKEATRPVAVAISVARLQGMPVGFERVTQRVLPGGDRVSDATNVTLMPRSPTELVVTDDASQVVTAGDRLKRGLWVKGDGRGLALQITLAEAKGGRHAVTGTVSDKPISGSITAPPGGIPSDRASSRRVAAELKKGKPFSFKLKEYHPSIDPLALVEATYSRQEADAPRVVHYSLGEVDMKAQVNDEGEPVSAEVELGSAKLVIEQVYARDDGKAGKAKAK